MQIIPLEAIPNQQLNVLLDGSPITLAVYSRAGFLYLDIGRGTEWIARGMLIVPGESILRASVSFDGHLVMIDTRSQLDTPSAPVWDELGSRYVLYHMTSAEYARYAPVAGVPV